MPHTPASAGRAADHGLHLLLEMARHGQEGADAPGFLAAIAGPVAGLVQAARVTFYLHDPSRQVLVATPGSAGGDGDPPPVLPCDEAVSDLLSQVVLFARVYVGRLDLGDFQLDRHVPISESRSRSGGGVLMAPWRAGDEHLGAVVAQRSRRLEGFTEEDATVLVAAGHAAGLVWQRKVAEQRLSERAAELERSLEAAKSSFLKLASHELRNPLTLLNGYLSMLADGSLPPERQAPILSLLGQAVTHMSVMVDQFLQATRLEAGIPLHPRPVDLRDVLEPLAVRIAGRWARTPDLDLLLPAGDVPVSVEVPRIETAIENLLDNAFKYSTPGAPVACDLGVGGNTVELVIRDQGCGMGEEEMRDLFSRFGHPVTPENSHIGGVGLGLYLSREIARSHGGDITATSTPGVGSRFTLTLPLRGEG